MAVGIARAAPALAQVPKLAPEACKLLAERLRSAESGGVKQLFDRGAEWARSNAAPGQIAAVGRYIELNEQLKFRCPVGFDNLVVAAIKGDLDLGAPPLPGRPASDVLATKKALMARRRTSRRRISGVPLPVRKPTQLRR